MPCNFLVGSGASGQRLAGLAPGVFAQQVVHQGVALGVVVQWTLDLLVFFIQQVAGRVEGEGFNAQAAGGVEQSADRIPLLGLQQVVALVAGDFAVQVVAYGVHAAGRQPDHGTMQAAVDVGDHDQVDVAVAGTGFAL